MGTNYVWTLVVSLKNVLTIKQLERKIENLNVLKKFDIGTEISRGPSQKAIKNPAKKTHLRKKLEHNSRTHLRKKN